MAKARIFNLPETKGSFQMSGIVTGTQKDKFFEEKKTKTGKDFRSVNFGIETAKDSVSYIYLSGMERDKVYFSKRGDKAKGEKSVTQEVPWRDRNTFAKEGFRIIGVNVGLKKTIDSKGKEVNDKKTLAEYDAVQEINECLHDGESIFTRGSIDYSTFNGEHRMSFVPAQLSLCRDINLDAENFEENAFFMQVIVFTGIEPSEDKTEFVISAKIVTYSSIEDAEFYIDKAHQKLALNIKKKISPYTAFKCSGYIKVEKNMDEVEVDDEWGDSNKMERQKAPLIRKLVITGIDPATFDTDTYSEERIAQAVAKVAASQTAKKEFDGSKPAQTPTDSDDWGSAAAVSSDEDEPW